MIIPKSQAYNSQNQAENADEIGGLSDAKKKFHTEGSN